MYASASDYMITYLLFLPFVFCMTALEASFRGSGDTRTPMLVGLIINVLNIFLDWVLIFGKFGLSAMGIRGAALATGVSFAVGCIVLYILSRKREWGRRAVPATCELQKAAAYQTGKKPRLFTLGHLGRIIRISLPSTAEQLAMSISQLAVMALAVTPMGSAHVASFHIVMRLASLSFMPGFGFAIAAATMTGQSLGQGRPHKASRLMWHSVLYCSLVMALISVCYYAFPKTLISLFTRDAEIHAVSRAPMRIYALFGVTTAITMVLGGGLRGAGDTKYPMIYMIISRFCIRIPFARLLGITLKMGLAGVWIAFCSDFFIRAILLSIHTLRGRWKEKKI